MPVSIRSLLLVAGVASVLTASPASGQIYKWVDERGVTHYADAPPKGRARLAPMQDRLSLYPSPLRDSQQASQAAARQAANMALVDKQATAERPARFEGERRTLAQY